MDRRSLRSWRVKKPVFDANTQAIPCNIPLELTTFGESEEQVHKATAGYKYKHQGKTYLLAPKHSFSGNILRRPALAEAGQTESGCVHRDEANQEEGEEEEASDTEMVHKSLGVKPLNPCSATPQLSNYGQHLDPGSDAALKLYAYSPLVVSKEMDYVLIECPDECLTEHLPFLSRGTMTATKDREPEDEEDNDVEVEVVTGSGNLLRGILSVDCHLKCINGSRVMQSVYELTLEAPLRPGDCGSLVRKPGGGDESIYGYIAGDNVESKTADVVPSGAVLTDVEDRLGLSSETILANEKSQKKLKVKGNHP